MKIQKMSEEEVEVEEELETDPVSERFYSDFP